VRHAKDSHVPAIKVVENHIIADRKAARAGKQVVAGGSDPWMAGQKTEPAGNGIDQALGDVGAAGFPGDVVRDVIKVAPRFWREVVRQIEQEVDAAIEKMDQAVPAGQASFRSLISLLHTLPGVSGLSATTILAEIGTDMSRFPDAGHLLA
jgi:hypothetical protein